MAYEVRINRPVTVRHLCPALTGSGLVSGQAANIGKALKDPKGTASAIAVSVAEVGTTGFYDATFTPDAVGVWTLTLTNPTTPPSSAPTDEDPYAYLVEVVAANAVPVADENHRDLTTLKRVRERLNTPEDSTQFDALLSSLITEVSGWIQDDLGRNIGLGVYTEYLDGRDRTMLHLGQGPVVSIDSLNRVTYGENPSVPGTMLQTLTAVEPFRYVIENVATDPDCRLPGILRRIDGSVWTCAPRGYKVVYVAGARMIPDGVLHLATTWTVFEFLNREGRWNTSRILDDAQIQLMSPSALAAEKARILGPYRLQHAGWI